MLADDQDQVETDDAAAGQAASDAEAFMASYRDPGRGYSSAQILGALQWVDSTKTYLLTQSATLGSVQSTILTQLKTEQNQAVRTALIGLVGQLTAQRQQITADLQDLDAFAAWLISLTPDDNEGNDTA
jgi:hypothetical protein